MTHKFKDKISFLLYVTSPENYGKLKIRFSEVDYGAIDLSIYPVDSSKKLPSNIYDTLHDIIWYHFYDTTELLGHSYLEISESEFILQNNAGELEIVASSFSSSHDFEKEIIIEQLSELLKEVLQREFMLTIHIAGSYKSIKEIKIVSYYLTDYDQNGIEREIADKDGLIKSSLIQSISSWAKSFSDESSNGEYDFDEFDLDCSISSYPKMDTWCNFYEESKGELLDISVLEIKQEEVEVEML